MYLQEGLYRDNECDWSKWSKTDGKELKTIQSTHTGLFDCKNANTHTYCCLTSADTSPGCSHLLCCSIRIETKLKPRKVFFATPRGRRVNNTGVQPVRPAHTFTFCSAEQTQIRLLPSGRSSFQDFPWTKQRARADNGELKWCQRFLFVCLFVEDGGESPSLYIG